MIACRSLGHHRLMLPDSDIWLQLAGYRPGGANHGIPDMMAERARVNACTGGEDFGRHESAGAAEPRRGRGGGDHSRQAVERHRVMRWLYPGLCYLCWRSALQCLRHCGTVRGLNC